MPLHNIVMTVSPAMTVSNPGAPNWFSVQLNDNSAAWVLGGSGCVFNGAIVQGMLSSSTIELSTATGGGEVRVEICLDTEEASVSLTLDRSPDSNLNVRSPVDGHISQGQTTPFNVNIVLRLI